MKKKPNIYALAARRIEDRREEFSCCAIATEIAAAKGLAEEPRHKNTPEIRAYVKTFMGDYSPTEFQAGIYAEGFRSARDLRVMLLCFAAAMYDAGDLVIPGEGA